MGDRPARRPRRPSSALFLGAVGSDFDPDSPLPPELEQGARALVGERPPSEADIPLDALAAAPFPKLVVSGAHHPAFDAICDALERELRAERIVLPGHGHSVQRHPDFNAALDRLRRTRGESREDVLVTQCHWAMK